MIDAELLSDVLSELERKELPLLRWGIVDGALSLEEVQSAIAKFSPRAEPAEIFRQLINDGLLFEVPPEGSGLYRTRMSEALRLFRNLRQTFRYQTSEDGRELISDFRIIHRPRERPKRNIGKDSYLQSISGHVDAATVSSLSRITPQTVSAFQMRSAKAVLEGLERTTHSGVMITAGTGAGKTFAFYGPALAGILDSIKGSDSPGVRLLALYPRGELLKDQFKNLLKWVVQLGMDGVTRPIRIGTWFGPTPKFAGFDNSGKFGKRQWREVSKNEYACPFVTCFGENCDGDLVWLREDIEKKRERLYCSKRCGVEVGEEFITLTRERAEKSPPDVMLTTTESLNRQLADASNRKAFGLGTKSLSMVLIDEIHTYEGISGAQASVLMRRLRASIPGDSRILFAGLSATLADASRFLGEFVAIPDSQVTLVEPGGSDGEMEEVGAEYLLALRHDQSEPTSVLSATIQSAMLTARILDANLSNPFHIAPTSNGLFGSKTFVFTDKLDVTNRLFWDLLDAEGWWEPGRAKKSYHPPSLAHLRSEKQDELAEKYQEPAAQRQNSGQWWWLPERLGHDIGENVSQLAIGRTSSQDTGVEKNADVIVATASLEVGYDDDSVGAVLQHKAPHDAGRFLQRRGRAGRQMEMRPWTIVTLSDWGRDRLAWEATESLFDPELSPRTLPISNRHVLRMQAVYATLDWLSQKIGSEGSGPPGWCVASTWYDLAAPAKVIEGGSKHARIEARLGRQERLVQILKLVLANGPERDQLRKHLGISLGLTGIEGEEELDAIFWSPPRSLLSVVLPTMLRRLQFQWAGEEPSEGDQDVESKTPLREFVAGNLFGELILPETSVEFPKGGETGHEFMSAARTIRELLPGSVTRHFGVQTMNRRHWVGLPQIPTGPDVATFEVDVIDTYRAVKISHLQIPGGETQVDVYQPWSVELQHPPESISESSSVRPVWEAVVTARGEGDELSVGGVVWQGLVESLSAFLLQRGNGVQVTRFARSAEGSVGTEHPLTPVSLRFLSSESSTQCDVALGYEIDTDALRLVIKTPDVTWVPSAQDRSDWLRELFVNSEELPDNLNIFDRANMVSALLVVIAVKRWETESISTVGLANEIRRAAHVLGTDRESLCDWLDDPEVLECLVNSVHDAGGEVTPEWSAWHRRRFATTVAASLIMAVGREHPELDIEDLSIDLGLESENDLTIEVWISEQTAGGNGQIEIMAQSIMADPRQFRRRLKAELAPRPNERSGREISEVVSLIESVPSTHQLAVSVQNSWEGGHDVVHSALENLRTHLAHQEVTLGRDAWAVLASRVLGPGCNASTIQTAAALDDVRESFSRSSKIGLSIREQVGVLSLSSVVSEKIPELDELTELERCRFVSRLLWPIELVSNFDDNSFNRFSSLPPLDRKYLREFFQDEVVEIEIPPTSEISSANLRESLAEHGEVVLKFSDESARKVRLLLLEIQQTPVEAYLLLVHPRIIGYEKRGVNHCVTISLSEVA